MGRRLAGILREAFVKLLGAALLLALLRVPLYRSDAAGQQIVVGAFSQGTMAGWRQKAFKGETIYSLVSDPEKKSTVLQSVSKAAALGRFRKMAIDLTKTPILNWSCKVSIRCGVSTRPLRQATIYRPAFALSPSAGPWD